VDLSNLMLEVGDVLLVRTNGSRSLIGRTAVVAERVHASFASYLIRFQLHPDRMLPEWVDLMTRLPQVRREIELRAASSAGQYNLGLKKLQTLELPSATLDIQERLLAEARDARAAETRIDVALARAEAQSARLQRAVLAAAFNGHLTSSSTIDKFEEMAGV
jgi:type I restriction enzyme S subunit